MQVKIKKLHKDAVIPKYALSGDAGLDLVATSKSHEGQEGNTVYGTGLAFEIPKGYVGLLFPRSSNAKKDLILSNSVGVLDSNYRGEVSFKFKKSVRIAMFPTIKLLLSKLNLLNSIYVTNCVGEDYKVGDRIGQIIILPYPTIEFEEVGSLEESNRGEGGYGSTGK